MDSIQKAKVLKSIFNSRNDLSIKQTEVLTSLIDDLLKSDCDKCYYNTCTNDQYPCNMCCNCYTNKFKPKL